MPPKTRALATSATASAKLEKRTSARTNIGGDAKRCVLSKRGAQGRTQADPLTVGMARWILRNVLELPAGKKSSHGTHPGTASAGVRPARIAVIGRQ